MSIYKRIHKGIIYLANDVDISKCDLSKDSTFLISKTDIVYDPEHEPTYTEEELKLLNIYNLGIE